jgi:hypothetical protein
MKTTFFVFVLALLVFSCNDDDDTQQHTDLMLDGSWSLVNVSGGFAGVDDDFEIGLITWGFDHDNWKVTITNNNTVNVIFDGLASGTYDYQLITATGEEIDLVVDSFSFRMTTLTSEQLILDEGVAADGFLLTFSR